MEQTGAQICKFRAEKEFEDEKVLDMRYIFWLFAWGLSISLQHMPQITDEQRAKFRDTFGKYFDLVEPLESDEKFFPGTKAQEHMDFCRSNILGDAKESITKAERTALLQILQDNRSTDYGRSYGFSAIHTYQAFSDKVPVTDYQTYEPMINLIDRLGEKNLLFKEDLQGFAMTSGKQGTIKATKRQDSMRLHETCRFKI